jgi:CubicO group peptidase (beta-lactamase class C family)
MMIHLKPCHRGKVKPLLAVFAAFAGFVTCGLAQAAPLDPAIARQIDEVVSSVGKDRLPGAVVLVARDGETVFRKAYGWSDMDRRQPMDASVQMPIGSVTKQFTATAIMMLMEEGKLSLSDSVARHLPEFAPQLKDVTVEQLLTHTSGVPDYTKQWRMWLPDFGADVSLSEVLGRIRGKSLDFAPGTRFAYSNSNYVLLGAIIEKLSGQSYGKFVEERIFVPLNMGNTAYGGHERAAAMRAKGYEADDGKFSKPRTVPISLVHAAGGVVSSVDDLARWDAAVSSGKLLKAESWQRVFTAVPPASYGYGWSIGKLQGAQEYSHGGSIYGYTSFVARLPEQGLYVAVLANASGDVPVEALARRIEAVAMGKPLPDYRRIALAKGALEEFSGSYRTDDGVVRTVKRDGDHLVIERNGGRKVDVYPYADNAFVTETLAQAEFVRDQQGRVVELLLTSNGNVTRNARVAGKRWWPL